MSTFVPDFNVPFNQFLVRDDEPLLLHAGTRSFRRVGIPCSSDCCSCWLRCCRRKVETVADGRHQDLLEKAIDPTVKRGYFIGLYF